MTFKWKGESYDGQPASSVGDFWSPDTVGESKTGKIVRVDTMQDPSNPKKEREVLVFKDEDGNFFKSGLAVLVNNLKDKINWIAKMEYTGERDIEGSPRSYKDFNIEVIKSPSAEEVKKRAKEQAGKLDLS